MQNKGAIKLFAIALTLVSIYQLSFTFITNRVRSNAKEFSKGDARKESTYLDSISGEEVYNFLWIRHYTYKECQDRELNLGLDLKGGMNVVLEVSTVDLIKAMANYSPDSTFNKAINLALKREESSREDFVTLFGKTFQEIDPNAKLSAIFATRELKDRINFNSTNKEVLEIIRKETQDAIDNSFNILRSRIDRFGVTQPNIQKLGTSGRILVELPGIKEPQRVRKLLQGTANLEFWETFDNKEVFEYLRSANDRLKDMTEGGLLDSTKTTKDSTNQSLLDTKDTSKTVAKKDSSSLLKQLDKDTLNKKQTAETDAVKQFQQQNPLFSLLRPSVTEKGQLLPGAAVGTAHFKDTSRVNALLARKQIKDLFPRELRFLWEVKAVDAKQGKATGNYFQLVAIKVTSRDGQPALSGSVITNARAEFAEGQATSEVTMTMNAEGAKTWARLTKDNIGKQIAIVLDNYVYSFPTVQGEIKGGNSQITGNFTIAEAKDLANILKSGKMPAPARIIQEEVVGPSLGKEAINAGLFSFVIAFIGVLLYMWLYYNGAGLVANIALFANVFFQFGFMASLGAVLTLPGIAGIVLTLAMAVDSNVIIYERMREELRSGKGLQLIVKDGFFHAYSSIIDGHVTTILTGIVLFIFGSGPVQGFATTLIIGLLLSLFSSIFIARLVFEWMLTKKKNITLGNKFTLNAFQNIKIDFIGIRKKMYYISSAIILIGVISLFVRGMSLGIDFTGGRTYVIRFDKDVTTSDVRAKLLKEFNESSEVKTFGPDNQVKITTKYLIKDNSVTVDSIIETKLYNALKDEFKAPISYENFASHQDNKPLGRLSSQKVGPVMAVEMIYQAFMAVFFGLIIIFIYITVRFKNWQYGLGGVTALFHDTMIVITLFSLLHGFVPFGLEVDQSFIAAVLTVIGYSIMDTVIIFDRIREYNTLHTRWSLKDNINGAISSTLGRTINTSGVTLVTLLAIFIFGGEILRGFVFAMIIGIVVGTYSSVFTATPIAYDIIQLMEKRKATKAIEEKK